MRTRRVKFRQTLRYAWLSQFAVQNDNGQTTVTRLIENGTKMMVRPYNPYVRPKATWLTIQREMLTPQELRTLSVEDARQIFELIFPMYELRRVWFASWGYFDIAMRDPRNVCQERDLFWD